MYSPPELLHNGRNFTPYTDLLLHDMGDVLADGIGDGEATGQEWRTPPLWGLKSATRFLHDGRAKSIAEAIELHGGEAAKARDNYRALSPVEQDHLHTFVSNL